MRVRIRQEQTLNELLGMPPDVAAALVPNFPRVIFEEGSIHEVIRTESFLDEPIGYVFLAGPPEDTIWCLMNPEDVEILWMDLLEEEG
jgi:hypothetical protein